MKAFKIIVGLLLLLGGLNNLSGFPDFPNRMQLLGYIMVTLLMIGIGALLLYSAFKENRDPAKEQ